MTKPTQLLPLRDANTQGIKVGLKKPTEMEGNFMEMLI